MGKNKILVMAGGTGGHIFPGLAVAKELEKRGHSVAWLGTESGLEFNLVPKYGFQLFVIPVRGIRGKGLKSILLAPLNIVSSIFAALKIIRQFSPRCVIGLGGFVAGPGGVAARLMGIPLVIHEQNAIAGTTNKLLSRVAKKVLTAFPNVLTNGECIGNPVREEFINITTPVERLSKKQIPIRILVVGGSRGALALNELMPQVMSQLPRETQYEVWHQAGANKDESTRNQYLSLQVEAKVVDFIDDIREAYLWADLVVCRAGALTVSELAAIGLAAIFVPFPFAIDDHQTANAKFLERAGAALVFQQNELTPEILCEILGDLTKDKSKLIEMAENGRRVAKPHATSSFADRCEEVMNG